MDTKQTALTLTSKHGCKVINYDQLTKAPRQANWQHARHEVDHIEEFFKVDENLGLLLGEPSGNVVDVDLDCPEAIALAKYILPRTPLTHGRASTPNSHWWYQLDAPIKTTKYVDPEVLEKATIVELRSTGGQTMIPPSIHPSGERLEWSMAEFAPAKVNADQLARSVKLLAIAVILCRTGRMGMLNTLALAMGGALARSGLTTEEIEIIMETASEYKGWVAEKMVSDALDSFAAYEAGKQCYGFPKLAELIGDKYCNVIRKWLLIKSDKGFQYSLPTRLTEFRVAEKLASMHGEDMRFVTGRGWFFWDGVCYSQSNSLAYSLIKNYCSWLVEQALEVEDPKAQKETLTKAMGLETANKYSALMSLLEEECRESASIFNTDPYLFNVNNGTIDLRTGELRPHSQSDRITKVSHVMFDPKATCPRWLQFIDEVTCGRKDLARLIQQSVGVSLSNLHIKKLFFLYGGGDNGKTTLINALIALLGEYHTTIPIESLCVKRYSNVPNDLARLPDARFVSTSETEQGKRINESLIKQMTGGGTISARFLRREWFDFAALFKIWIDGNYKPIITGTDSAIWDRIILLPFDARFEKKDPELGKTLRSELSGILNWALAGFADWKENGLIEPECTKEAKAEYRKEQDLLGQFLDDTYDRDGSSKPSIADVYGHYCNWCARSGIENIDNKIVFGRKMVERGIEQDRGRRHWCGLRFKPNY